MSLSHALPIPSRISLPVSSAVRRPAGSPRKGAGGSLFLAIKGLLDSGVWLVTLPFTGIARRKTNRINGPGFQMSLYYRPDPPHPGRTICRNTGRTYLIYGTLQGESEC